MDIEAYLYKGQTYPIIYFKIPKGAEDVIDRVLCVLFDQWRKLTDEILSEITKRYEIGESVFPGKRLHPNSSQFDQMSIVSIAYSDRLPRSAKPQS